MSPFADVAQTGDTDFYDTNGNLICSAAGQPPSAVEGTPPAANTTDYTVTETEYAPCPGAIAPIVSASATGPATATIDNAGSVTLTDYDLAGRVIETDQDYVNGVPTQDSDITTTYQYDNYGRLASMTVINPTNVLSSGLGRRVMPGVLDEQTSYVYGSPYDASLQTGVIYPDCPVTEGANGDWAVNPSGPTLELPVGESIMAPTLNPTNNNGPSIPLSNAAQWYLLGNSSSGNVTLPGRLFPDSTTVAVGGAYYTADSGSSTGWCDVTDSYSVQPPVVGQNQGFFVQPSEAFTLTLSGITGSTTSDTYNLSDAVVSDGTTTKLLSAAISAGWLTMYSWNTSSQSFTALSGTETISPWIGYWFDATKALTVTFGAASSTDFTSTTYNRLGWVTSTTDQRGVTHNYTYGPNATSGAEQLTLDSAVIPAGSAVDTTVQSIGTAYDDLGRVSTVTSYGGVEGPGSNVVNQVQDVYDGWGNVVQEWQASDGPLDETDPTDPNYTPSVKYAYLDGASTDDGVPVDYLRLGAITYPNGRQLTYNYAGAVDSVMSQLSSIDDSDTTDTPAGAVATYEYLGTDTIVSEEYNEPGVTLDYSLGNYSGLTRLGQVQYQEWMGAGSSLLDGYQYGYNAAGDVSSNTNLTQTTGNQLTQYGYWSTDRVGNAQSQDGSYPNAYQYDAAGNPVSSWDAQTQSSVNQNNYVNGANELFFKSNAAAAQYDAAGNMTAFCEPGTGTAGNPSTGTAETAVYDAWDRLVQVNQGSTIVAQYRYDGAGRQVEVLTNFTGATPGSVTHNYYSGQQVIETRDGTPDAFAASLPVHYQYIWSARGNNSLILRDDFTQTPGTTAARLYYLNDANFNVTALVGNVSGVWQPVERYAYDPYGNVTVYDPTWATVRTSGSLYHNTILFAGCALDPLTGLYQMGARYYDSAIGRFISRDPLGYLGSPINLYAYCGDNPLNYTDPTGLTWYKPWTWGLNTEGTVGNRQIGERWQIDGTWFEEVQLPDGTRTPLPVGSRVVNDPDGGYHIQYPDGHVSHAGRPDTCAPSFRSLWVYYTTHPTTGTKVGYAMIAIGVGGITLLAYFSVTVTVVLTEAGTDGAAAAFGAAAVAQAGSVVARIAALQGLLASAIAAKNYADAMRYEMLISALQATLGN